MTQKVILMLIFSFPILSHAKGTDHIPVVSGFDFARYLGVWYEIVRSDNSFERNLTHVTATYTKTGDGTIRVVNRGYNIHKNKWVDAKARGKFNPESDLGEFSVSFFWPFTAKYRVIELGQDYDYAVVTSNSMNYFWILCRQPAMDKKLLQDLLSRARSWGFETEKFIMTDHYVQVVPKPNMPGQIPKY